MWRLHPRTPPNPGWTQPAPAAAVGVTGSCAGHGCAAPAGTISGLHRGSWRGLSAAGALLSWEGTGHPARGAEPAARTSPSSSAPGLGPCACGACASSQAAAGFSSSSCPGRPSPAADPAPRCGQRPRPRSRTASCSSGWISGPATTLGGCCGATSGTCSRLSPCRGHGRSLFCKSRRSRGPRDAAAPRPTGGARVSPCPHHGPRGRGRPAGGRCG